MSESHPLQVLDVSRRFGRTWAVRKVSFSVTPGTITVLTGHNGSGKSTLLRLMSGALRPTEGQVLAWGGGLRASGHRIAWLDHQPAVYADLTGRENLAFWRDLSGQGGTNETLDSALERVGLASVSHRRVRGYSRGMVQRLALANVLLRQADLWLLDEPTTGLDAEGRETLVGLLAEARDLGRSVVIVTHNPAFLGGLVDASHQLDRGRIGPGEVGS